ncbi:metallo-beta-lactamase domain protein [Bacteriovorax sp. BSW11_IV]|uniref:MBL fold metallo-hydrolase n=1 Tax=Bacteriovorax sp. BSW11_IV TaxID=1353529 RepID=UPI00038A2C85|nr:MBL fold metallo-hydrolase [Bacteriovorax sp. BSW11_IV]EQC47866.1 metallo-beta-lactamase domain protein [Bacteriovorax sp. BSW11_IV]
MKIEALFDESTYTMTYIVFDEATKDAVVIDPVLDYDSFSGKLNHNSYHKVLEYINAHKLNVHFVLETHAHADHLSSSQLFKKDFPGVKIGIGKNITQVQETFKEIFNLEDLKVDGSQFDSLFADGEEFNAGVLKFKVFNTPGHTPACVSYYINDSLFVGDAIFMPDYGTGRCDFPKGDAKALYNSVHNIIYSLPKETKIYVGHDYMPGGRPLEYKTTVQASMDANIQLKGGTSEADFIKFRTTRDATLQAPRLLLPSIQVNINAGELPEKENNGIRYLKLPIVE